MRTTLHVEKNHIMKTPYIFVLFFVSGSFLVWGQNLVENPSFEEIQGNPNTCLNQGCGFGGEAIKRANGWGSYSFSCDLYLPESWGCFQSWEENQTPDERPQEGIAYAGFQAYYPYNPPNPSFPDIYGTREFLGTRLTCPLQPNVPYRIQGFFKMGFVGRFSINKLGFRFQNNPSLASNNQCGTGTNNVAPAHIWTDNPVGAGWTEVSGVFVPDTSYSHLLAGVFAGHSEISFTDKENNPSSGNPAYYNVDNISVVPLAAWIANTNYENMITISAGTMITLEAFGPGPYNWISSSGETIPAVKNPTVSPTSTTTYSISADLSCTTATTMITVQIAGSNACVGPNLVPNPSFEENPGCPQGIVANANNDRIEDILNDWEQPTNATPDYYNRCATDSRISVPTNNNGTQNTPDGEGDGFVGFYALSNTAINYREYLQVRLSEVLTAGSTYRLSLKLNLRDNAIYSTDEIGVLFEYNSVRPAGFFQENLSNIPQLTTPADSFINDKDNWTTFSWEYTATGGEEYMVIGNFNPDATTNLQTEPVPSSFEGSSYYYLDDVFLTELLTPGNVDAGTDITILPGENTQLESNTTGTPISYLWSPAIGLSDIAVPDPIASPTATTTYTVTVDFGGGCTASDTVNIIVEGDCRFSLSGGMANDATCALNDGSVTGIMVNGASGSETYTWTDANGMTVGNTIDLPNVGLGTYTLSVTDGADCEAGLTFNINEDGPPNLNAANVQLTTPQCDGNNGSISGITFIGDLTDIEFVWTDAAGLVVGSALEVTGIGPGTYILTISDGQGCGAVAGPFTLGNPLVCDGTDTNDALPVKIANTMTPNGDGANDTFYMQGIENYPNNNLAVYNRWGKKVFETKGYSNDWNGTSKGKELPVAVYYFVLRLNDPEQTVVNGYINILK